MKTFRLTLGVGLLVLAAATLSAAQPSSVTSGPDRWAPWLGCWQVTNESIEDAAALLNESTGTREAPANTSGALVCVTPAAEGGATLTTYVNDQPVQTETIVASGAQRPLTDPNCRGWQRAEWSALGARIYAKAEVTCGDRPTRTVSGLGAIVTGPRWIDIQLIESEGRKSMRVRRYHRAAHQRFAAPVPSATQRVGSMPIGARLSLADVKEASASVPSEVVQAAVLELSPGGYELNAERLLDLDRAGVSDTVIDLMVAMSFPEEFVVERASGGGGGGPWGGFGPGYDPLAGFGAMWPLWGWSYYMADPFYYSSYSPFGYRYWGYYDPYYYRGSGVVVIDPGNGGVSPIEPSGTGRVVDGRGYTRIRRNEPEPANRVSTGRDGGWSTATAGGSSGADSGSNGVSSGGYSSGGSSSSSGGRTAVRRPPGGE